MNDSDDNLNDTDAELGAAYRDLARETVPPAINAAVLKMAAQNIESRSVLARISAGLRPLAFVATAGLTLALVVQLNNTPDIEIPDNLDPNVAPLPATVFQDAANQTAEQIRQLEENPGMSMPPASATASAPAAESGPELSLLPTNQQCDEQARASSGTWWQCIRELEQRGLPAAAEQELQALLKAHPQFSAPQ
jgi:hypothetical protein